MRTFWPGRKVLHLGLCSILEEPMGSKPSAWNPKERAHHLVSHGAFRCSKYIRAQTNNLSTCLSSHKPSDICSCDGILGGKGRESPLGYYYRQTAVLQGWKVSWRKRFPGTEMTKTCRMWRREDSFKTSRKCERLRPRALQRDGELVEKEPDNCHMVVKKKDYSGTREYKR